MSLLSSLRTHPFPVEAHLERSIVLTFAVPKGQVLGFLPECLEPDTLHDEWAFVAVAMVQTRHLRPKGFPAFMGNDFFLIGYRIFVRFGTTAGKRLRGLYILQSQTDKRRMERLGNLFTQYRYSTVDIQFELISDVTRIESNTDGLRIAIEEGAGEVPLPAGSPFADWKEARRFAGPLPFTFSYLPERKSVLIVEGVRENWTPAPVRVLKYQVPALHEWGLGDAVLANAFILKDIPYHWKKGRLEPWSKEVLTRA